MVSRAEASGDPPAKAAAYTNALYAKDPQFRAIKALAADAAPRPVSPVYPQISSDLQSTLSAVFANQIKPAQALSQAGPAIKALAAKAGA
jgi:multiple sugar transport system substrate-binding protein